MAGGAHDPADLLPQALATLTADLRARTQSLLGLPAGEDVTVELVRGEPWAAFNYYLGCLRSRVVVNVDLPVRASLLVVLVTHECYPGHHTERATKEALLVRERGQLEETIMLVGTPQALVSEAVAEVATHVLLGDEEEQVAVEHLRPLGLEYDSAVGAVVRRAGDDLRAVGTNAALLLHEHGAPLDEVREYLMRWSLSTRERADKSLQFITDPTWRAYVACYSEGRRLGRSFVRDDVERFRRLLTVQLVPDDLLA